MRNVPLVMNGIACAVMISASSGLLTHASAEEFGHARLVYPNPSPDGTKIAIHGNFDGRWQLYVVDAETEEISRLHISQSNDRQPAWSNSGEHIAFLSDRDGSNKLFILDLETGDVRALSKGLVRDGHPKWGSNDEWIYFNRNPAPGDRDSDAHIARIRPDGTDYAIVADSKNTETFAAPSPDGQSVAFVEWFPHVADDGSDTWQGDLVVVNIESGDRRRITESDEFNGYPVWASDGRIYFSLFTDGTGELHRINPDGSELEPLNIGKPGQNRKRPYPDNDAKTLYYNVDLDGSTRLFRVPLQ